MKSTVVSFDWIASSGSLKLTEINTDVSLGGYSRPEYGVDFDALAQYCSDQSITEVKLHHVDHSYYTIDWMANSLTSTSPEVFSKLSSSLATHDISASIYLDENNYEDGLDEIDEFLSGSILDLRIPTLVNSKLDYHAVDKENLINFVNGIGSGSLMPEAGSSQIASNNATGIPDFVWKVPFMDSGIGLSFYESSDNNTTISSSNEGVSFVEKYYPPDNDKWGYFAGDISYKVVLTEDGNVIPISSHKSEGERVVSFSRVSDGDYTNKDLVLRNKLILTGVCGESTDITLADGSTKTPLQIHSSSISDNSDSVKTVKIDDLNLDSFEYNTPSTRQGSYTSYTGSFNFTTGSNHFMFVPKYSENCVTIDSTVFDGETLIPVESASSWEIKKASDVVVGDKYLNSSMAKGTVGSVGAASNQVLVHPLSTNPKGDDSDMYFQRSMFCDDILTLAENKFYTINEPHIGDKFATTSASSAEMQSFVSTSNQQWALLNHNSVNGTIYNWSNYSGSVAQHTENILIQMSASFSSSMWDMGPELY